MKYTRNWLKDQIKSGKTFTYFGFWGDRADKPEERAMSNFHQVTFEAPLVHGDSKGSMVTFSCSEQYFMYLKAVVFNDLPIIEQLLINNKDGNYYKKLGRKVGDVSINPNAKPYDDVLWDSVRDKVMYKSLYYKFKNPKLKKWLLDTGDSIIVEASPFDRIWGVGLGKQTRQGKYDTTEQWKDVYAWKGDNKLGFLLMEIRDTL